jgi:hypothetical protein
MTLRTWRFARLKWEKIRRGIVRSLTWSSPLTNSHPSTSISTSWSSTKALLLTASTITSKKPCITSREESSISAGLMKKRQFPVPPSACASWSSSFWPWPASWASRLPSDIRLILLPIRYKSICRNTIAATQRSLPQGSLNP